jgi:ABC-type nitrate/sulfonate/bicarbonate transport system permease component
MYAAILALAVFGLACYLAVDAAEAALCRWRDLD